MQSFRCVVFSAISYGPEDQDELASSDNKPRILLLGLRRFVPSEYTILVKSN